MPTSKRVPVKNLEKFCTEAFVKSGLRPDDAATVAKVLTMTDTWGTYSHGTGKVRNYMQTIRAGGIDAKAQPKIAEDGESYAIVDNHGAMGMVGSCLAMEAAIQKADKHAISWVGVRNGSHFGAAGYYANMAAERDMIGIAVSNADPNMTIPGARGHVIGNNPLAYAVPAGKHNPILLDIALSAVAFGKIMGMKQLGQAIPPTWITDADGMPTTDLSNWPATGSMIPMAGHKGYGIALLIEVITSLLTGAGILDEAKSWVHHSSEKANLGHGFIVINIGKIIPIKGFKERVDNMIDRIHNAPKAKDSERIYVPGEIEWGRRKDALENGVILPELTYASLLGAADDIGMDKKLLA